MQVSVRVLEETKSNGRRHNHYWLFVSLFFSLSSYFFRRITSLTWGIFPMQQWREKHSKKVATSSNILIAKKVNAWELRLEGRQQFSSLYFF